MQILDSLNTNINLDYCNNLANIAASNNIIKCCKKY